jgi:hypothetical protein
MWATDECIFANNILTVQFASSEFRCRHLRQRRTVVCRATPHGIVAMHVSNRNLELAAVVAGVAEANSAITHVYEGGDVKEDPRENKWVPRVAAVGRREQDFGALANSKFWPVRERDPNQRVWTDDYSNIVGAMIHNLRDRPKGP